MTIKLFAAVFAATLLMQPVMPTYIPDETDVTALAQMAYGEARGLAEYEIAAVMWVALNRLDHGGFGVTVTEVVAAPGQFAGYSTAHPVDEHIAALARDVLARHHAEQQGEEIPREIGPSYLYFSGDGVHNYFREIYDGAGVLPEECETEEKGRDNYDN